MTYIIVTITNKTVHTPPIIDLYSISSLIRNVIKVPNAAQVLSDFFIDLDTFSFIIKFYNFIFQIFNYVNIMIFLYCNVAKYVLINNNKNVFIIKFLIEYKILLIYTLKKLYL